MVPRRSTTLGMMEFKGRVVLVTGGGRGIGRSTALAFAQRGASVIVSARTRSEVDDVAGEIRATGGRALAVTADVVDDQAVNASIAHATAELGPVEILVNNAGGNALGRIEEMPAELWWQQIEVNIRGTYNYCRAVLPEMVAKKWGRIINVSSINGKQGAMFCTAYCSAKHAVIGLTRALALDVAKSGITVNAVCPGYVKTRLTEDTFAQRVKLFGMPAEELEKMALRQTPQGVTIEPEQVAEAVVFLASDGAKRMTGQAINVDGGRSFY